MRFLGNMWQKLSSAASSVSSFLQSKMHAFVAHFAQPVPAPKEPAPPPIPRAPIKLPDMSKYDTEGLVQKRLEKLQQRAIDDAFERLGATISRNQDPGDYISLARDGATPSLTREVLGASDYELKEEKRLAEVERVQGKRRKEDVHTIRTPVGDPLPRHKRNPLLDGRRRRIARINPDLITNPPQEDMDQEEPNTVPILPPSDPAEA